MAIESSISKALFEGNGATTVFPFDFKVWKGDQIQVLISSPDGKTSIAAGWSADLTETGGSVTYQKDGAPLPKGWKLAIVRNMPFVQLVDLLSGTRFDPQVIEDALDFATAERQQLREAIERAVTVSVTDTRTPEEYMEDFWQAVKDVLESVGIVEDAEDYIRRFVAGIPIIKSNLSEVEDGPDGLYWVTGFGDAGKPGQDISNRLVVADGSTEARTLGERAADVVNVKDFGAKGDGVTDDTEAIQKALDYHVSGKHGGKIMFPNGTYIVTDSIILKNRSRVYTLDGDVYSTQWPHVDLCGSSIAWHGPDNEKPVFIISANNGLLENGQILGAPKNAAGDNHRALCCAKITSEYGSPFAFRMDNMQLNGYTRCGLMIGDEEHLGSYGCQISNTYITANNSIDDWENNGPAGIELYGADCKFINVTTQRNKRHVWLHTSGHQFTNCHFISTTKDQSKNIAMPETAGIWYSLRSTAAWYQNTFIGCYFDNVKYVIYNDQSHSTVTQLSGCFYFNMGTVFDTSKAPADAYLLGGPKDSGSPVFVRNFSIQPSSYVRFLSGVEASKNYSMLCSEDYAHDTNMKQTIACPWAAKFKVRNNTPIRLTNGVSDKFAADEMKCIGGLLVRSLEYAEFRITIMNRSFSTIDATFKNVGGTSEWVCETHSMFGSGTYLELSVNDALDVDIRGTSLKFVPICLKNVYSGGEWSGELYATISSPMSNIGMYLVYGGGSYFNVDELASVNNINISKTQLVKAVVSYNLFGGIPLLPNEDGNTITKNINTIRTSGTYPIRCDSTTVGAPFEGYGILEVFSTGPRIGISPNPITYQRATQINTTSLNRLHRKIYGENGSSITEWENI